MLKYRIQRQIFVILLENNFCARLEGLRQGGRRNLLSKVIISGGGWEGGMENNKERHKRN